MQITIPYKPRAWTKSLHEGKERWKVIVAHRRAGKTVATLNHLQRDALLNNNSRYAYIAPTYKQSKNIAWDLIKYYANAIPGVKFNEAELRVDYPNGSRITLYGADNPDSLRGLGLWGVGFDEYSQQPSNIFTEIIRPALADHEGYAIWIGTPQGKNEFYRLYEHAKKEKNWLPLLLTVDDTKLISDQELEDANKLMSEDEFNQEWYCSFEASIKGAYYAKEISLAREEQRITNVPYDKYAEVHTWWDIGIGDSTTIGFFQHIGKERHMIDYHEASGEGLEYYVKILKEKNYNYGKHYAPHDAQAREKGSGKSYVEIAKEFGIEFEIVPKLSIEQGINAGRMKFNTLWIDETRCERFLDALSQYRKEWNDKMGDFKKNPLHDWTSHAADMFRYWAVSEFEANKETETKPKIVKQMRGGYGRFRK
jgi:hypothetical protein